ncbi:DUF3951 domain-containing protein [Brevibacillus sp. NRS-1366]|uniref:DUF3951 domain-containing protein n=1 Tax=Brevibacillus sp. NRS-1366 TaxID=3233899 RepID=UPI003D213CBA
MSGLIIAIPLLILVALGMACYQFFIKKKTVEHYYTPLDRIFGQTPIEYHEEKIEKKESEDEEGDDKDKHMKMFRKKP